MTLEIRAARRYRWRVAGGRLRADEDGLRFVPNRLERLLGDAGWACAPGDLVSVSPRPRLPWMDVTTTAGVEGFRVRAARSAAASIRAALLDAGPGSTGA